MLILFGVAAITFLLLFLVPADPARIIAGRSATAEAVEMVRHQVGLDRPLAVQFGAYLWRLAHGNLGRSYLQRTDVTTLLMSRLPATLWLLLGAVVSELAIGLPIGILAAVRQGRFVDRGVMVFAFLGRQHPAVRHRHRHALRVRGPARLVPDRRLRRLQPPGAARPHPRHPRRRLV